MIYICHSEQRRKKQGSKANVQEVFSKQMYMSVLKQWDT